MKQNNEVMDFWTRTERKHNSYLFAIDNQESSLKLLSFKKWMERMEKKRTEERRKNKYELFWQSAETGCH